MNQSTITFAFLSAAFLIFITQRGELQTYMGFILGSGCGNTTAPATGQQTSSLSTGSAANVASAVSSISQLAALAG